MRLIRPFLVLLGSYFGYVGVRKLRMDGRLTGRAGGMVVDLVRAVVGGQEAHRPSGSRWSAGRTRPGGPRTSGGSSAPARYREGQPVLVAYDPAGVLLPQLAGGHGWLGALFILLGGLLVVVVVVGATLGALSLLG